ncbi:MAG: spore cortex biosynthesis protein YabQ [Candidatus Limivicinus sp.]
MEINVYRQLAGLLIGFLLGAALGLMYDVLRPLRRRCGRAAAAVLDVIYTAASAGAAFAYGMGAENGRIGIWELAAILLGFLIYMHRLSDYIFPFFNFILLKIIDFSDWVKKLFKKIGIWSKMAFQNTKK